MDINNKSNEPKFKLCHWMLPACGSIFLGWLFLLIISGGENAFLGIACLLLSFLGTCAGIVETKEMWRNYSQTIRNRAKKIASISVATIMICGITGLLVSNRISKNLHKTRTEQAQAEYISAAYAICDKWNTTPDHIEVTVSNYSQNSYTAEISVKINSPEQYETLYLLIKELNGIRSTYPKIYFSPSVTLNGIEYYVRDRELRNEEYETVYVYKTEKEKAEERELLEKIRESVPYEGMDAKYIDKTILGTPAEHEYSHDYYAMKPSHRMEIYRWYNSKGKIICVATVSCWDYAKDEIVDDYVSGVSFYWELSKYN